MKLSKKEYIYICVICILAVAFIASAYHLHRQHKIEQLESTFSVTNPYAKPANALHPDTIKELQNGVIRYDIISYADWEDKLKQQDSFVFYGFTPNCEECVKDTAIKDAAKGLNLPFVQANLKEDSEWESLAYTQLPVVILYIKGQPLVEITGKQEEQHYSSTLQGVHEVVLTLLGGEQK